MVPCMLTRLAQLRPLSLCLVSLFCTMTGAMTGCGTMSEAAYFDLQRQVQARNDARRVEALERLEAEGYVFVDEERSLAFLDDASRAGCVEVLGRGETSDDARARLTVQRYGPDGVERPDERTSHEARLADACHFFLGDEAQLVPTDGAPALHQVTGRVARSPDGRIVLVRWVERTVATHRARVEMTCDHMPSGEPSDPGGPARPPVFVPVLPSRDPPATRVLHVDVEQLEASCSHHVH